MSTPKADRANWKPLSSAMLAAVAEFDGWTQKHLTEADIGNRVTSPLYHYTDAAGLTGMVQNEEIWFTRYTHLNDPGEITYGMEVATNLLKEIGEGSDPRIKLFCEMIVDLFTHENMKSAFEFFVASFSRSGDDLGQWRGYGDNGRGYSLGLAPHLFHATAGLKPDPSENFVVLPVVYGKRAGRSLLMPAIEKCLRVAGGIIVSEAEAMQDVTVGMPFFDALAKGLIASELLLDCMMIKHEAYESEKEVRLVIVGQRKNLSAHIATRSRRGEIVPFIKSKFPIRADGSIAEIVVGPSSAVGAEDGVRALLLPLSGITIRRSTIPYRST